MGQYFKAVLLGKKEGNKENIIGALIPGDYANLMKITEHAYLRNSFVNAVMNTIAKYKGGVRVAWAGDYAKKEQYRRKNLYEIVSDMNNKGEGVYIKNASMKNPEYRYLLNETKGEAVDLWDLPEFDGWTIHPLPILTADGNEEGGGGTYHGTAMKYVGSWARDVISVQKNDWNRVRQLGKTGLAVDFGPKKHLVTKYYKVIKPDFAESYALTSDFYNGIKAIQLAISEGLVDASDIRQGLTQRGLNAGIIKSVLYQKPEPATANS